MRLSTSQLVKLFFYWAQIMQQQKNHLIELDSIVGDGDLGLTMSDGFSAAYQAIATSEEHDIGKLFFLAGKSMANSVPSTMGTLMAAGLIQVGKDFKGKTALLPKDFTIIFSSYLRGVQNLGQAQLGEKTFIDGLYPAIIALNSADNSNWRQVARQALAAAKQGVLDTQTMLAKHGRAATRGEASRALLDPGAYVAELLMEGYVQFVDDCLMQ